MVLKEDLNGCLEDVPHGLPQNIWYYQHIEFNVATLEVSAGTNERVIYCYSLKTFLVEVGGGSHNSFFQSKPQKMEKNAIFKSCLFIPLSSYFTNHFTSTLDFFLPHTLPSIYHVSV